MPHPEWSPWMSRRRRRLIPVLAATAVVAALLPTGISSAAPAGGAAPAERRSGPFAEGYQHADVDNRAGSAAPDARQRGLARKADPDVRWNKLGTPHALGPGAAPLATGLPAEPEAAARAYLAANRDLFGLDADAVADMERVLVRPVGSGAVVTLRQRFGDLPAGYDGLVTLAVSKGKVLSVSSSLSRDAATPTPATLSEEQAYEAALTDAGLDAAAVASHSVRTVAVPTPLEGPRSAYEVTLIGSDSDHPAAFTTYIDGITGKVLVREDLVDFDSENPSWAVFPATPPRNLGPGQDPRVRWCADPAPGCRDAYRDPATGNAWDVDAATGTPTFTSRGNSANTVVSWGAGNPMVPATTSPERRYEYPFTDQWHQAKCNPEVFTSAQRNDTDAAIGNLFAMHNRMHDWAYQLGFTESAWNLQAVNLTPDGLGGDAEQGRAQQGALSGNRNNANQGTPRDGLPPTTNMYLWQPQAGGPYPPCVDGDYDMTVIGHEYTHAISNRMIAGPDSGIGGHQGGSMGESWSDLLATEFLFQHGLRAPGETPFIVGGYVTGNLVSGIRNYDLSRSPLNYSDVGYNTGGPAVHADGEIWGATNHRVRSAMVKRYGLGTPKLQLECAQGKVPADRCPGNRRWSQLVFDSFLLQAASQVSMLDMRDNMLTADLLRFDGKNQDLIWAEFARSGMGRDAVTNGAGDTDPTPSFASPSGGNATFTLRPRGESADAPIRLYVGAYEARATPVADTDPATALGDTVELVAGTYDLIAVAPGFGHQRMRVTAKAGHNGHLDLKLDRNLASTASGATVSGDGVNLDRVADDTEATNWASLDGVAGKQVTVALPGDKPHVVKRVNVSAMLRPAISGDADAGSQNALSSLRSFAVLACNAKKADCTDPANFTRIYTSKSDAFPGGAYRAYTRDINLREFRVPTTQATHLRLEVLASQCTGGPAYAGEQDADPATTTDCATASPARDQVRIAEFQAFSK
ncbi:M36 family metallopeptidase [Micromonospora avicenniae]|uniref:Peptidase propeptide and YPEB domain-containing protein n=1 Tax=Micromonospora avicenniae TaxID=1198245 RepID=A0A1N7B7R0_9ACTN|nr:M36 family metallopeptidase [Micromonospora avicenniae]SIR47381.1 Peptidase propeptide and YPEB domain-containing protein [Micromonospora avicenniae]